MKFLITELAATDPFNMGKNKLIKNAAFVNDSHLRLLRTGHDMIDNCFEQMHALLAQARSTIKDHFKTQLAQAFTDKYDAATAPVNEKLKKLEEYLATVTPDMSLLRTSGRHLILSKQVPKT